MKRNLSKIISVTLLLTLACIALLSLPACGTESGTGGSITLMFTDENLCEVATIRRTTDAKTLSAVMDEVEQCHDLQTIIQKTIDIKFACSVGMYGTTINSYTINGTTYGNWDAGKYVMLYTSLEDAEYIAVYEGSTIDVSGKTYNACGLGADTMPIIDGATYVFSVMEF